MWVYDTAGGQLYTPPLPNPCCAYQFQKASGSFTFKIPNLADPRFDGIVMAWFNDTVSLPARFQQAFAFFEINSLSVIVTVNPKTYAPGGIVTTTVTTVVTRNQAAPSPFDPPEPGMNVVISVFQITPLGLVATTYGSGAQALQTDLHGKLTYVFQLLGTAPQSDYEVHAIATHPNTIWNWESQDTFTVSVSAGITQVLGFARQSGATFVAANEFQAGDVAQVTSVVSGVSGGATLTYIFEVRDTTSAICTTGGSPGSLLAKATQSSAVFQYAINRSFQGIVCFRVTADDGQGNRVTTARSFTVVFGWLLVNADRREYNPLDTVTISWNLVSNRITNPSYFYEVRDSDGNLVASGTTNQATSFPYPVPNPSSSRYTFTVTATELGRTVAGSITLTQVTGFFITASFDRNPPAYSPGETMTIHYTIAARSANAVAPATYRITYGLLNGPTGGGSLRVSSTGAASGDLTYTVPTGIDEGDQLFQIAEANTATQAIQVVTIRSTSPLWYVNIGDVPVLVLVMLVWLVLMTLLLWRKGVIGGMRPRAPREAPAGPTKQEPVHAAPGSPMTVTCRSCGSPIEITTSKRPIEVMCPKCGNTEVVS